MLTASAHTHGNAMNLIYKLHHATQELAALAPQVSTALASDHLPCKLTSIHPAAFQPRPHLCRQSGGPSLCRWHARTACITSGLISTRRRVELRNADTGRDRVSGTR